MKKFNSLEEMEYNVSPEIYDFAHDLINKCVETDPDNASLFVHDFINGFGGEFFLIENEEDLEHLHDMPEIIRVAGKSGYVHIYYALSDSGGPSYFMPERFYDKLEEMW
jgi:hypothetical protein